MLRKTFHNPINAMLDWQTSEKLQRKIRREGHIVQARPEPAHRGLRIARRHPGEQADMLEIVPGLFLTRMRGARH